MKILADSNIVFVQEAFGVFGEVTLSNGREITNEKLAETDILLVRSVTKVNEDLLKNTPVKFVASATIGTDHIDLSYLQKNCIGFAHAPGSNATAVAEYVVAAILEMTQRKKLDLQKKCTLGIIGVGNIGTKVLSYAQVLGINCLLCDPPKKALTGSDFYVSMETVLSQSDIITLHVPLSNTGPDATYHMVNSQFLSAMKKDAILINTSRGDVIDESSLIKARPRLGGVILDVFSNEPKPHSNTIAACDITTPHIAGYSFDGKVCGSAMIYEATCAFFFKAKTWRPPNVGSPKITIVLDNNDMYGTLGEAISKAYSIKSDDEKLRKILELKTEDRGSYFDELRKTYPKRFEFCNYSIFSQKKIPSETLQKLINLGFLISEP